MKDEIFDKYQEAGLIAAKILRDGAKEIRVGTPYLDIVESIESRVIDEDRFICPERAGAGHVGDRGILPA